MPALMPLSERSSAESISRMVYCNPFLPERIECERVVLGDQFDHRDAVWNLTGQPEAGRPNLARIQQVVEQMCESLRQRLAGGAGASAEESVLYEDLVLYALYYRHHAGLEQLIVESLQGSKTAGPSVGGLYAALATDLRHFFDVPGLRGVESPDPAHLFACFFQIRRAFFHIFHSIVGRSHAAARLRAGIWQSIFSHDMRRYRRVLYDKTGDFTTLIVGPSGTGKELVARAIGAARYIPFDLKRKTFTEDFAGSFHALNLSALSPTLIESELFGHRRGAFTGAIEDRQGWLEVCPPLGAVFLDEVGELDGAIQVKLLRVLQSRTFQRLGDTTTRLFKGKIIAATNRDLAREIDAGRFRRDFYYRLCSDVIVTPSLREQLADGPRDELHDLARFIAERLVGRAEADAIADEVVKTTATHLGRDYAWPGNFRELEQCVRNILVRGEYVPIRSPEKTDDLAAQIATGSLTADELLSRYCAIVYAQTGSYEETGRRLELDRRTVRAKVAGLK